jgi:hypothetical protein
MHRTIILYFLLFSFALNAQELSDEIKIEYEYYQTIKQVVDSSYYYNWDEDLIVWNLVKKDSMVYDSMGVLLDNFIFELNESGKLSQKNKVSNLIQDHEVVSSEYGSYIHDEWIPDYKIVYL